MASSIRTAVILLVSSVQTVGVACADDSDVGRDQLSISTPGPLPRRGLLGALPASVTKEIREQQRLASDVGVVLAKVIPGTSAAEADLKAGDLIHSIDGEAIAGVAQFLETISNRRAGDLVVFGIVRDGKSLTKRVTFKEFPREKDAHYSAVYGHVTSRGSRLRTILTRPKNAGSHPAVLLLQGYGNFSIDHPVGHPTGFTRIARHLARSGYVTMRVDRRGCGDSEGGPCRDMDFETELDGYRQALKALKATDFVDQDNIFIYGQSLGGFTGPILAAETPVRGIVSYGTIAGSWLEGILAQRRRWVSLEGISPAEVEKHIHREMQFWYPLLVEKKTPAEILHRHPEYTEAFSKLAEDNTHVFQRPYSWLHQVVEWNMGKVWTKVASTPLNSKQDNPVYPRVLCIWGKADWISERKPIEWIAEIVNRAQPGQATFVALDLSDHFYFRAESMQESFRYFKPAKEGPFGEFNPAILETVQEWLDETSGFENRGQK